MAVNEKALNLFAYGFVTTAINAELNQKTDRYCSWYEFTDSITGRKFKMGYFMGKFYLRVMLGGKVIANITNGKIYIGGKEAELNAVVLTWFDALERKLYNNITQYSLKFYWMYIIAVLMLFMLIRAIVYVIQL